ncbi:MAG: hypothetical protein HRT69_13865 [Flavobacteriaceae bacterium]|nr:hypothetical protein [Flavobacteriaceae bacterium]
MVENIFNYFLVFFLVVVLVFLVVVFLLGLSFGIPFGLVAIIICLMFVYKNKGINPIPKINSINRQKKDKLIIAVVVLLLSIHLLG